ncbi:hypothetical protein [Actinoplanes sp. M2I2]|uniref:hypothetical protein n=1 Tax=Actinoplanes sp. M2I2 TaxID=1734444 RepID=UPI002021AFC2|nr:hypothetical protein [Actinoplanes sp. M2I2]
MILHGEIVKSSLIGISETAAAECRQVSSVLDTVGRRWSRAIMVAAGRSARRFTDVPKTRMFNGSFVTVVMRGSPRRPLSPEPCACRRRWELYYRGIG